MRQGDWHTAGRHTSPPSTWVDRRSQRWVVVLAGLVIAALLAAFHQVVASAVQQGKILRMDAATHEQAVWRCNALRGDRVRASCLAQLIAPPLAQADDSDSDASVDIAQVTR